MPLFKIINLNSCTQILVWKITESLQELSVDNSLTLASQFRLESMKSEVHQCAFLSVRKLLQHIQLTDADLIYDQTGKPFLSNQKHISISHSHQFAVIIVSNQAVGIDIEIQTEKIIKIAKKFSAEILNKKNEQNYIQKLTQIWAAKEAIFKIKNQKGISFKDHIFVNPFKINQKKTTATLHFDSKTEYFKIHFHKIENYSLVYALFAVQ